MALCNGHKHGFDALSRFSTTDSGHRRGAIDQQECAVKRDISLCDNLSMRRLRDKFKVFGSLTNGHYLRDRTASHSWTWGFNDYECVNGRSWDYQRSFILALWPCIQWKKHMFFRFNYVGHLKTFVKKIEQINSHSYTFSQLHTNKRCCSEGYNGRFQACPVFVNWAKPGKMRFGWNDVLQL